MTLATLKEVLQPALAEGYAVGGLVTLGWEDMRAFVTAAEEMGRPVILQAGPGCRAHTPLPVLGAMFRNLAEAASVPVVAHLDHGYGIDECRAAIAAGFTSVMFDGSRQPLEENIRLTAQVAELARENGVSCEGEIGFVGYDAGEVSRGTNPGEAARFVAEIEAATGIPLVIHGGSGVPGAQRLKLAQETAICKFNIGTELRQAFGAALRAAVEKDPSRFDRVEILKDTHAPMVAATKAVLATLGGIKNL